jgi:hypothetical protein
MVICERLKRATRETADGAVLSHPPLASHGPPSRECRAFFEKFSGNESVAALKGESVCGSGFVAAHA